MSGVPQYNRPHNGADAKDVMQPVVGDGSMIFDKEENRNNVFSESAKTRNTITHVPYRGNEQHGVEFNTPAQDYTPYWSEQAAQDKYMSPEVGPRDIVPMKPVPVQVVERPDLIHPKRATMLTKNVFQMTTTEDRAILSGNMTKLISEQRFRRSLKVYVYLENAATQTSQWVTAGATTARGFISLNDQPALDEMASFTVGALNNTTNNIGTLILDLNDYWGPVHAVLTAINGTPAQLAPVTFRIIATFDTFEGEPLL